MTENMSENMRNLISSAIDELKLLENKTTDSKQERAISRVIILLHKKRVKIDTAGKNPYEEFEQRMQDITTKLKVANKKKEEYFADIENIIKTLKEMFY